MTQYRGRTEDASSVFLGADFWKQGKSVAGTVVDVFATDTGVCYSLRFLSPVEVDGEMEAEASIGTQKGLKMALRSTKPKPLTELRLGDRVHLECTGFKPTTKGNPMILFAIEVERDD